MQKETILILDDEKNIRLSVQITLENDGYTVLSCHDAIAAFSEISKGNVDLAILDIRLQGIDGLSLFDKMHSENVVVPTIFISGHASLSEAAKAVQMGAFDFIEKPFTS